VGFSPPQHRFDRACTVAIPKTIVGRESEEAGQEFAAPSQRRRLAPSRGGFRAPERSGLFGREHRSAENRLWMAGAVEFLPSLEAPPATTPPAGSGQLIAAPIVRLTWHLVRRTCGGRRFAFPPYGVMSLGR